jgi:hypothetical protein
MGGIPPPAFASPTAYHAPMPPPPAGPYAGAPSSVPPAVQREPFPCTGFDFTRLQMSGAPLHRRLGRVRMLHLLFRFSRPNLC